MLSTLDIRVVIPGHGDSFTDVEPALERAFKRLTAFEADSQRMARHALKVLLTFALLDRRQMRLADLPAYVDRVPIYRDFNARFFGLAPSELAATLVGELERVGAVRRSGDFLTPG